MNKPTLISTLAIAAAAVASLSLPTTAAADTYRHRETTVVRSNHQTDTHRRPAYNVERRGDSQHHASPRWEPPRHQHHNGHHYGHQAPVRVIYRPVPYYAPRHDYRPVVRYQPLHLDDLRLRLSYDLHF